MFEFHVCRWARLLSTSLVLDLGLAHDLCSVKIQKYNFIFCCLCESISSVRRRIGLLTVPNLVLRSSEPRLSIPCICTRFVLGLTLGACVLPLQKHNGLRKSRGKFTVCLGVVPVVGILLDVLLLFLLLELFLQLVPLLLEMVGQPFQLYEMRGMRSIKMTELGGHALLVVVIKIHAVVDSSGRVAIKCLVSCSSGRCLPMSRAAYKPKPSLPLRAALILSLSVCKIFAIATGDLFPIVVDLHLTPSLFADVR